MNFGFPAQEIGLESAEAEAQRKGHLGTAVNSHSKVTGPHEIDQRSQLVRALSHRP